MELSRTNAGTALLLRREVGLFRARETRRVFDPVVSVGVPAGQRDSFVVRAADLPVVDLALRVDVLCSMLEQSDPAWRTVWLTRPGDVDPHEGDLEWLRAAGLGFAIQGRELGDFYVVTRTGWRDVRTGDQRTWKRLRL
ncbi:MAG: hypothetical protein ACXVXG_08330 [Nocardioidaceae bacterium]